jgi:predicted dehydrogenase
MVIVGTAHMHVNEIAMYIHQHPLAQLTGVADLVPAIPENTSARYTRAWNLRNIADTYHVPVYPDYKEMLLRTKPDLAFILCENDRKREAALACAAAGVDFCLEKPMSMTLEEAEEINTAAAEAGVEAIVNWPVIWREYVNQLMHAVGARVCGEPIKIEYANGHTGPLGKGAKHRGVSDMAEEMNDEIRAHTWWYQQKHGGGVFLDILCYGCLYAQWILGRDWQAVTAMGMNLATPYCDCADNAAALVRYDKKMAVLGGTWTTPNPFMMTGPAVFCTDGVLYCSRDAQGAPCVKSMDIYGKEIPVPAYEQPAELTDIVCNYIHHKETGASIHQPSQLAFNIEVISLLEASVISAKNRREIEAAR